MIPYTNWYVSGAKISFTNYANHTKVKIIVYSIFSTTSND